MADIELKHRIEYALFRAAIAGTDVMSDDTAARIGEIVGSWGYPLGVKKRVVDRNLRIAFPDESEERRAQIARASYAHLGRETMMMLRLSSMTRPEILHRTRIIDEAAGRAAYLKGNGVVIVAGHLGNWELGAALIAAREYRIDVIAKRASNPLFYQRILDARARLGVGVIDFQHASRQALKALRAGRAVAFAADQWAGSRGIRVPFFGHETSMYRGPAVMALRTGAPMFLSIPLRMPDGSYEMRLEPVEVAATDDMEADISRVTAAYVRKLEDAILMAPEQYLWHHRRWRD